MKQMKLWMILIPILPMKIVIIQKLKKKLQNLKIALLQLLILILVIIHPIQKAMTAILKTKSLVLFITSILFL